MSEAGQLLVQAASPPPHHRPSPSLPSRSVKLQASAIDSFPHAAMQACMYVCMYSDIPTRSKENTEKHKPFANAHHLLFSL